MKKRLAALLAVATLFLFAGCSFSFYQRQAESKDIYKDYLAMETDASDSYTERVAERSGAAVVTVIANSVVRTNRGSESTTQIFSGIIINAEGYVLTTSHAAVLEVTSGGSLYTGRVLTAYAVLPEIYGDKSRYKLTLVDYNTDAGLALFRFYDRFHYYTDTSRGESKEGFQVFAQFSGKNAETGERCIGIGNSLGNALNEGVSVPERVNEIEQTVMSGVISDADAGSEALAPVSFGGKEYNYILTTVPVNIDMYGGALFDENGYLIGLLAMKIGYESSSGETGYFKRVAAACPVSLLTAYIDGAASATETPVPYIIAMPAGEAA